MGLSRFSFRSWLIAAALVFVTAVAARAVGTASPTDVAAIQAATQKPAPAAAAPAETGEAVA